MSIRRPGSGISSVITETAIRMVKVAAPSRVWSIDEPLIWLEVPTSATVMIESVTESRDCDMRYDFPNI